MGVYIRSGVSRTAGRAMPDNCLYDCKLRDTCSHVPRWAEKDILSKLKISRHSDCPLIEVEESTIHPQIDDEMILELALSECRTRHNGCRNCDVDCLWRKEKKE